MALMETKLRRPSRRGAPEQATIAVEEKKEPKEKCCGDSRMFIVVGIVVCIMFLFRLVNSNPLQLQNAVVCDDLTSCDLTKHRIIYAPEQITTITRRIKSADQVEVERPDKKITHTTTKEELSQIEKRSAVRKQYILKYDAQNAKSTSEPVRTPTQSDQTRKQTPPRIQIHNENTTPLKNSDLTETLPTEEPEKNLAKLARDANRLVEEVERFDKELELLADPQNKTLVDGYASEAHFPASEIHVNTHIDKMAAKINLVVKESVGYGRVGGYEHESIHEAEKACKENGFTGLCSKEEVINAAKQDDHEGIVRNPKCYSGWTSGGEVGWYQVKKDPTCGGPKAWQMWKPTRPGAHCCGIPKIRERLRTWFEAGCTEKGLLFPDGDTQSTWATMTDPDRAITEIAARAQQGDRISQASCYGLDDVTQQQPVEDASGIIFHLLWECYGQGNSTSCQVPEAHRLCMITLRHLHLAAQVIVWSKSLDQDLFEKQFQTFDFELRRYDLSLFDGLPQRAQDAARGIQSFFSKHENSYSHWSDLFRSSVLYKHGGIYADLDNIWFRPIERVISSEQWIPATQVWEPPPKWHLIERLHTQYYLEGGIMRMNKGSPFLAEVLENFPVYDQEAAECWSCVGPQHLTETWARLNDDSSFLVKDTPELIDSQLIYGVRDYRNQFAQMFLGFEKTIWLGLDTFGCAGAHLFTSSAKGELTDDSLVAKLFTIGGVEMTVHSDITWRKKDS